MRHKLLKDAGILLFCCIAALPAAAEEPKGVGVIAYSVRQGQTYILLADHVRGTRGWGTFGGYIDGQPPEQAAARELREETRCVYDFDADTLGAAPRFRHGNSWAYVLSVPYVPAHLFGHPETPAGCDGPGYHERGPYAWVPLGSILRSIEHQTEGGAILLEARFVPDYAGYRRELWQFVAESLVKAREMGLLPEL